MLPLLVMMVLYGNFVQKWHLPIGCAIGISGNVLIADADHDNCFEIYISDFHYPDDLYICELHPPNTWEIDSFSVLFWQCASHIGDFDRDGLCDLLVYGGATPDDSITTLAVCESSDSQSYPTTIVWSDVIGPPLLMPLSSTFDIDQDGLIEIVQEGVYSGGFFIYENRADNQYPLAFSDTLNGSTTCSCGDFDRDGYNEIIFAQDYFYVVYESPADNIYERTFINSVPAANVRDCCAVSDMDGDGKWEFMIKGCEDFFTIDAYIFEATGDNVYDTVKTFSFPGGDYYGDHSDAGDVDGDSIPEIVLAARQNVYVIKSAANDSFYVWQTLPGNHCGMNIRIFDIDNNGLNDIIMSTEQQTWIYEWVPGAVDETAAGRVVMDLDVAPNPARKTFKIRFATPEKQAVNITLLDITGRVIREIFDGKAVAGMNEIPVLSGNLANGVYFIRLESEGYNEIKKVVILD